MSKVFTLYYTGFEKYEVCPQSFLWSRGWGTIDVGGGPGRKKPEPVKDSKHHALMGHVIQKIVELLYNQELWKQPEGLLDRLLRMVEQEFTLETASTYIDWRIAPAKHQLLKVCKDGVQGFLQTMKQNRLLGTYARAEVELLGWVDPNTPIGGRADLIIRGDAGVTILDGKNSQQKGKYTNPDQLRWYALCYYLVYGVFPDRLGFVYYRYPAGSKSPEGVEETGVDWVTVDKADIEGLAKRIIDVRRAMGEEKFEANPSPKACQYCVYQTVCEARIAQKAANSKNRKKKETIFDGGGFTEF